jgi:SAM-dependent methyltransferase
MSEDDSRPGPGPAYPPRAPEDFAPLYEGAPPWDINEPQPAFRALAEANELTGSVLDVGCGTGEHALLAAGRGLPATGVDLAPLALERARAKAAERGLPVRFLEHNALDLGSLDERFDTVLDSGLFHVFTDSDRAKYVISLAGAVRPGSRVHLLGFSDQQPGDWGPRRLTEDDIRTAFADGWQVTALTRTTMAITHGEVQAWVADITRITPES